MSLDCAYSRRKNNPGNGNYISSTTNYGGGDGSGTAISSLGPFNFSTSMLQFAVGHSWSSWNCPPFTESCRPKGLHAEGASTLTLSLTAHGNTAEFEFEPDEFSGGVNQRNLCQQFDLTDQAFRPSTVAPESETRSCVPMCH